jgi:hypothetical protein
LQTGEGQDSATRIGSWERQLEAAKLELREAETARDSARQQLNAETSASTSTSTQSLLQESALAVATPEIDRAIEAQKKNLDGLLQRFTEQHPTSSTPPSDQGTRGTKAQGGRRTSQVRRWRLRQSACWREAASPIRS